MLSRLYIESFALIEQAEIEFGPGLNVITGETGAGKSILMGALNSILGGPASAELVRTGADKSTVEGLFEVDVSQQPIGLADLDIGFEDGQLMMRREIRAGGRSRAFVNGASLPLQKLQALGSSLVDLHGQHQHQSLLNVDMHRRFLDETSGLTSLAQEVSRAFGRFRELDQVLSSLESEHLRLEREGELRQFQLDEIRRLAPQPDEESALEAEVLILENQASLIETSHELRDTLYEGENSIVDQLGKARRSMSQLAHTDPSLAPQAERVDEFIAGVSDLAAHLGDYARSLEADPERLLQARERLDALQTLRRKYGESLADVLDLARELEQSEDRARQLHEDTAAARRRRDAALEEFSAACLLLSARRGESCEPLARAVERGLNSLGMTDTAFAVHLQRSEDADGLVEEDGRRFAAHDGGVEHVEFFVSANPGEELRPLARVASGGEISRIMLVLKEIIAHRDLVSTLVFDEIDAGISGRVAAAVGKRLQSLAASHQLIVITHLPQIASLADCHFAVRKQIRDGRARTEVSLLDEAGRAEEIANLLAGETVSTTARRHAAEMLE